MRKKSGENGKKPIEMRREALSLNELFPRFVAAKTAEGVSEGTVTTYYKHWLCIGKHLDLDKTFDEITQDDINNVVVSMRESGLAHNSISSYTVLRWMMDNIYICANPAGRIKADNEKSMEKIDGAVATIMALDCAIRCGNDRSESVYENPGATFFISILNTLVDLCIMLL